MEKGRGEREVGRSRAPAPLSQKNAPLTPPPRLNRARAAAAARVEVRREGIVFLCVAGRAEGRGGREV